MRASLFTFCDLPSGTISIMARPRGGDWLPDEMRALREAGVAVLASFLTPGEEAEFELGEEAMYCEREGMLYAALPIQDRSVPPFSAATFDFLTRLHEQLTVGKHVALHCRQGLGRAALMAASLLALSGIAPDEAFARLSEVRGCAVPETEEQREWVRAFYRRVQSASVRHTPGE